MGDCLLFVVNFCEFFLVYVFGLFYVTVSDSLSVFPDVCCRPYVATESSTVGFYSCVDKCSVQICCQPITATYFIFDLSGTYLQIN